MYVKIESARLDFYRQNENQTRLRTELYQGLIDSLSQGESSSSNVGKRIVLPGSFIGGPRDMRHRYMDAMSLVKRYGKSDILLTMTWSKMYSPEAYDRIVGAELPDIIEHEYLHGLVVKHTMHGPCGTMNPTCACMRKHIGCKDNYPKQFYLRTVHGHVCASFREAADMMGLLQTDNAAELCLLEAVAYPMPNSLLEHTTDPKSQQEVVAKDIESERNITVNENDLRAIDQLNKDQRNAYEQILNAIMSGIALATVTSGIAASILPGGCTAHSRFKIPLHDDDSKSCHVRKQTVIAQLIRDAQLIIWDGPSMVK
nr:uncharacterized protein LOC113705876 [Coffea arabica]